MKLRKRKPIRNPALEVDTDIIPRKSGTKINVNIGGQPIYTLDTDIKSKAQANYVAQVAKETVQKQIRRQNPVDDIPDFGSYFRKGINKAGGVPSDPIDAFALGRMSGIDYCIKELCGKLKYFKRRKVAKALAEEMGKFFEGINRKVELKIEGQAVPIPIIGKRGGQQ